jgi:hypothetical protein
MQVGDVTLRSGTVSEIHCAIKVHKGTDRMVQSADVEYKLSRERKFIVTTRPIHKLMMVPIEEQSLG